MRFLYTFLLTAFSILSLTAQERKGAISTEPNQYVSSNGSIKQVLKDRFGRTLILHGLNTSSSAKNSTDHQPWVEEKDVVREDSVFGFNTVRYLIFWGAIEPQKGVYDEHYLQELKKRVSWYTDRKMYVILDMHQDIYGFGVGGDGAPAWASTHAIIQNLISDKKPWWMQNLEPKVKRSYTAFWRYKKKKYLQQHYIATWQKVAGLFKDNPYVIGYDLMNEPYGGKVLKTLFGSFEKKWLMPFYERLIPAIRNVDSEKYLFIEPRSLGVNFGMKSHLKKVKDALPDPKLIYAPHCYPRFVDIGKAYNKKARKELSRWFVHRQKEVKMQQTSILIGEFGLSPDKKDFNLFLNDFFKKADEHQASWTYWSNDLGGWSPLKADLSPSPILNHLLRVYPKTTAGSLNCFSYDPNTRIFKMDFTNTPSIHAPTEIVIPKDLYPNGYEVSIAGTMHYKLQDDMKSSSLLLWVNDAAINIKVTIQPK